VKNVTECSSSELNAGLNAYTKSPVTYSSSKNIRRADPGKDIIDNIGAYMT